MGRLPDGSGFFTASLPLPEDHWLYDEENTPAPMPLRAGTRNPFRGQLEAAAEEAARYAVRASTMRGADPDFDPDSLVQNFIVGLIGYYTEDGLCGEEWADPKNPPDEVCGIIRRSDPE